MSLQEFRRPQLYQELCAAFRRPPGALRLTPAEWTAAEHEFAGRETARLHWRAASQAMTARPARRSEKPIRPVVDRCLWLEKNRTDVDPVSCRFMKRRRSHDHITDLGWAVGMLTTWMSTAASSSSWDHAEFHFNELKPPRSTRPRDHAIRGREPELFLHAARRAFFWLVLEGELSAGMRADDLKQQYHYVETPDWPGTLRRLRTGKHAKGIATPWRNAIQDTIAHFKLQIGPDSFLVYLTPSGARRRPR